MARLQLPHVSSILQISRASLLVYAKSNQLLIIMMIRVIRHPWTVELEAVVTYQQCRRKESPVTSELDEGPQTT
ncbi:hypothetical protein CY34DRAFT_520481 [Suillus luteus UH-Slu-Lm8-n1]|uniref:Uncharacterized protein n=1 Tax=Suillus luteus UH-Slu-Lm8-n1 TaxID=930992 RepID=A0A0D0AFJ5_9AGAM|nr:hypothetical protein CY34DRAFT_520481 [Suillus luteus UH-Slu-Lm8-n1]